MTFIKINKVRRLDNAIAYVLRDNKTRNHLVTTFGCDKETIKEEFEEIYRQRQLYAGKQTKNKARMIIQSFDPQDVLSPEDAHAIGVSFAEEFLEGHHQFVIVTHIDNDHLHNHIIFNEVDHTNYKMFDTKRHNSNTRLHQINNRLSTESNLHIIEKPKVKKATCSHKEYVARAKKKSYKGTLEQIIDVAIKDAQTFEEFLEMMHHNGIEVKRGRHIAFKMPHAEKYIRGKTIGIDYTEESINYRINHPEFEPIKIPFVLKTKWIDKNSEEIKNSIGLKRWASRQNIQHLQEISKLVYEGKYTLDEIEEINNLNKHINQHIAEKLNKLDDELYQLNKHQTAFDDYAASATLIKAYKQATDKEAFKREYYEAFKKFDKAKRSMRIIEQQGIKNKEDFTQRMAALRKERDILYEQQNKIKKKR